MMRQLRIEETTTALLAPRRAIAARYPPDQIASDDGPPGFETLFKKETSWKACWNLDLC